MSDRARAALAFALVAVLALAAYVPSFSVPFQFDDYVRIFDNEHLKEGLSFEAIGWLGSARIVPATTVVLNFLVNGENTFGYHVVNFAVHLLATLAVFQLALAVCATPRLRATALAQHRLMLATAAAFIFACHPLQTQAVTYIIQRFASMAALFYVWCVVFYLRGRIRSAAGRPALWMYLAAMLMAVGAILSKENAASLPLAILLSEWVFYDGLRSPRAVARVALLAALFVVIPLAWKVATVRPPRGVTQPTTRMERVIRDLGRVLAQPKEYATGVSPVDYFLTQCTVLPRYLGLLALPINLNVDHDVVVASGLSPAVVLGLVGLLALTAFGFAAARRGSLVGYGILWFFIAMSVESSLLPISDVMVEHRMYLAMPGLALALASLFTQMYRARPAPAAVGGAIIAATLLGLTFARNQVWLTPLSLWSDAALKSPRKARVHVNVGVAEHMLEHLDEAIDAYCRALALDPDLTTAQENLEIALEQQGRLDAIINELVQKGQPVAEGPEGAMMVDFDIAGAVCPSRLAKATK